MLDGQPQAAVFDGPAREAELVFGGPSAAPASDLALVAAQIQRIGALADAGRCYEGREACADLVFDFQPFIAAHPELLRQVVAALKRCEGHQLLGRLTAATQYTSPACGRGRQAKRGG
jgi:hypothetical protein